MLSNTATPRYYGQLRDAVIRGDIPVCKEIYMEMNRILLHIEKMARHLKSHQII